MPASSSSVRMVANRPASAYSVRSMTISGVSVRGSASTSSTVASAGSVQCGDGSSRSPR